MATALGFVAGGTVGVAAVVALGQASITPSDEALSDIAQIGATLLVAYAIETSWFVKESRARGSQRENWIGFVAGIGLCGVVGIALAIALIGVESSSFLASLGVMWIFFSLGFLASLVALLPYIIYDWVHTIHTEYSDE